MSNRSFNMAFFLVLFVFVTIVSRFDTGIAFAQSPSPGMPVTVFGKFKAPLSDKDGKPRGISGMSCLGKVADIGRECIVVNDEERFAEIAILTQAGLIPTVICNDPRVPSLECRLILLCWVRRVACSMPHKPHQ